MFCPCIDLNILISNIDLNILISNKSKTCKKIPNLSYPIHGIDIRILHSIIHTDADRIRYVRMDTPGFNHTDHE